LETTRVIIESIAKAKIGIEAKRRRDDIE